MTLECEACRIAADPSSAPGGIWDLSEYWTLNAALPWSGRPWFVLQTAVHRADLSQLTPPEAAELGLWLQRITAGLTTLCEARKVYVYLLNELSPSHVHIHLVVSTTADLPGVRGPGLIGSPLSGEVLGWEAPELTEQLMSYLAVDDELPRRRTT